MDPSELRLWVHYLPSFYHFHVHCAHTRWDGFGLQAGKAILLNDVIGDSPPPPLTFVCSYAQRSASESPSSASYCSECRV